MIKVVYMPNVKSTRSKEITLKLITVPTPQCKPLLTLYSSSVTIIYPNAYGFYVAFPPLTPSFLGQDPSWEDLWIEKVK